MTTRAATGEEAGSRTGSGVVRGTGPADSALGRLMKEIERPRAWPDVGERGQPSVSGMPGHTCVAGKGPRGFTFKLWRRAAGPASLAAQIAAIFAVRDHRAAARARRGPRLLPCCGSRRPHAPTTAVRMASGAAVSRDEEHTVAVAARTPSSPLPGSSTPGHGSERPLKSGALSWLGGSARGVRGAILSILSVPQQLPRCRGPVPAGRETPIRASSGALGASAASEPTTTGPRTWSARGKPSPPNSVKWGISEYSTPTRVLTVGAPWATGSAASPNSSVRVLAPCCSSRPSSHGMTAGAVVVDDGSRRWGCIAGAGGARYGATPGTSSAARPSLCRPCVRNSYHCCWAGISASNSPKPVLAVIPRARCAISSVCMRGEGRTLDKTIARRTPIRRLLAGLLKSHFVRAQAFAGVLKVKIPQASNRGLTLAEIRPGRPQPTRLPARCRRIAKKLSTPLEQDVGRSAYPGIRLLLVENLEDLQQAREPHERGSGWAHRGVMRMGSETGHAPAPRWPRHALSDGGSFAFDGRLAMTWDGSPCWWSGEWTVRAKVVPPRSHQRDDVWFGSRWPR
ncbi:uncharacterized protein BDZ99DRAFT_496218 [Mytilinidion resinicola]|uniref:Uncharacterized protein n=1 Tax=Mytilinidion resinicola TaxID=574789 RepID=A0A6A6YYX5_9PEZI|nr:uncharacterized protein BDZ99DRAFT_496218 [Mytilinidion resinicola]KAF2813157.1 hypothetical protein BDZ99DRAFT_496218 [Mytilinidion resinicola]